MTEPNCLICTEKYNKSRNKPVKCQYCDFECCKTCCQTYILDQTTVRCMNNDCAKEWTRQYIRSVLPLTFINNELKQHKERVLFDQERALMPATQPLVERQIRIEALTNEEKEIHKEMQRMYAKINEVRHKIYLARHRRDRGDDGETERATFVRACPSEDCKGFLSSQWKCGICQLWTCPSCHVIKGNARDAEHTCNPDDVATAELLKTDTKPCPKCGFGIFKIDGCFGENTPILLWDGSVKMSQDIQVGDILVGDDGKPRNVLRTFKGEDELYEVHQNNAMNYIVNSKHTLVLANENNEIMEITVCNYLRNPIKFLIGWMGYKINIKSDENYIVKTEISVNHIGRGKYYGWEVDSNHRMLLEDTTVLMNCSQMFCTQCHTAFDWRTGRIESGNIHNPHYFEWMRRQGNNIERNPDDVICGRELSHHIVHSISSSLDRKLNIHKGNYSKEEQDKLKKKILSFVDLARNVLHIRGVEMYRYEFNYERYNEDLRILYMRNLLSENEFKHRLQIQNKKQNKNIELRNVFRLVVDSMTDIIFRFQTEIAKPEWRFDFSILNEVEALRQYANECLLDISRTYCSVKIALNEKYSIVKVEKPTPAKEVQDTPL